MPAITPHPSYPGVIPDIKSRRFNYLFSIYLKWLFYRRFDAVFYKEDYRPGSLDSTVWYMNHHSWWDALIPIWINGRLHRQDLRALMDEVQLLKYPFFRKLGVFSVDRSHPRKAYQSLQYAADLLTREHTALYIFPQGSIRPEMERPLGFESGLAWLYKSCPSVDVVPVVTTMNTRFSERPRLFIRSGAPVRNSGDDREALTIALQEAMMDLMDDLHAAAEEEFPLWIRLL